VHTVRVGMVACGITKALGGHLYNFSVAILSCEVKRGHLQHPLFGLHQVAPELPMWRNQCLELFKIACLSSSVHRVGIGLVPGRACCKHGARCARWCVACLQFRTGHSLCVLRARDVNRIHTHRALLVG
jgi:hypothetical protein